MVLPLEKFPHLFPITFMFFLFLKMKLDKKIKFKNTIIVREEAVFANGIAVYLEDPIKVS